MLRRITLLQECNSANHFDALFFFQRKEANYFFPKKTSSEIFDDKRVQRFFHSEKSELHFAFITPTTHCYQILHLELLHCFSLKTQSHT